MKHQKREKGEKSAQNLKNNKKVPNFKKGKKIRPKMFKSTISFKNKFKKI